MYACTYVGVHFPLYSGTITVQPYKSWLMKFTILMAQYLKTETTKASFTNLLFFVRRNMMIMLLRIQNAIDVMRMRIKMKIEIAATAVCF